MPLKSSNIKSELKEIITQVIKDNNLKTKSFKDTTKIVSRIISLSENDWKKINEYCASKGMKSGERL